MKPRIDIAKQLNSDAMQAMLGLNAAVLKSGLEGPLYELIKIRASQINGCAYCIDMHTKDARAAGESEQRIYALNAWRETPFFSERERAALEWTEALTMISGNEVPDELFERVRKQFNEDQLVGLTMAVVTINAWNRIVKPFRAVPGTYQPAERRETVAAR